MQTVSDADREGQLDGLDIMHEQAHEALVGNDYRRIERDADALLKAAGLALDHNGAEFGRLCRRLLRARIEYTKIEAERWNGVYKDSNNGNHRPVKVMAAAAPVAAAPPAKAEPVSEVSGPLFSAAVNQFLSENPRAKRTEGQARIEFEKFMATLGGDRPVSAITKADGRAYKDELMQIRKAPPSHRD